MAKWWSWIPGLHGLALNKCRREVLSIITGERLFVERMAQRQRPKDEPIDQDLHDKVLEKIREIHVAAEGTNDIDELDDLTDDAELQGLFAAYLCPVAEIKIEGDLVLDQIDGWGIPKSSTETASKLWDKASENLESSSVPAAQVQDARGALYALFAERDGWRDYLDDHEEASRRLKWILFAVLIASLVSAVLAVYYAYFFPPFLVFGIFAAGVAGSCASVLSKLPTLEDRLRKTDYVGGVLARIATGIVGTVIGSALLAWVPLSIEDKSFGKLVSACATAPCATANPSACTTFTILIVVGVPTLLGFSERTLPFFEQRIFGKAGLPPTRSRKRKI